MLSACGAGNAFIHEGPAEIIAACVQTRNHAGMPHLHPRRLDVGDVRMENKPSHRMHQHRFAKCRSAPGTSLEIQRRFHMHKGQRHKLCETAGLDLGIAQATQMTSPVDWAVNVAVHDGRCRLESDFVGRPHDFEPLRRINLVRTNDRPHFVIKHLAGSTRQRPKASRLQARKVGLQILA